MLSKFIGYFLFLCYKPLLLFTHFPMEMLISFIWFIRNVYSLRDNNPLLQMIKSIFFVFFLSVIWVLILYGVLTCRGFQLFTQPELTIFYCIISSFDFYAFPSRLESLQSFSVVIVQSLFLHLTIYLVKIASSLCAFNIY